MSKHFMNKGKFGIMEYWNNGIRGKELLRYLNIPSLILHTMKVFKSYRKCLVLLLVILTGIFAGCFTRGSGMMNPGFSNEWNKENSFPFGNLEGLWNERTIRLIPVSEGSSGFPLMGGGSPGGMRGTFPLNASATIIDSALMNRGLDEFASLANINNQDKGPYRARYKEINKPDEYLFIWLELKTSYSKDLLNLDNWSIFLEDNNERQFDPANIVEYPEKDMPKMNTNTPNPRGRQGNNIWQVSSKVLQLYFPKKLLDGSPLINNNVKNIKLVMFNWSNNARYEGWWYINPDDSNSLISEKPEQF